MVSLGLLAACEFEDVAGRRAGTRSNGDDTSSSPIAAEPTSSAAPSSSTPPPDATTPPPPPPVDAGDDPGPPPPGCGAITKDAQGFFRRNSGRSEYVGYVPSSYTGAPTRLFVGLHGCGDNAYNFATWGVAPFDTRATQDWIGISVEDADGGGHCWSQTDDDVVLAAIDDISKCFYVHKHEVVLGGFSSGGELAYGLGMRHASRFAGLLIECSTASAAGDLPTLLAGATWKLPIAHAAHTGDTTFPLATVRADWATITAAGFPLQKRETAGGHDGTAADWSGWLHPKMKTWRSP